MSDPLIEELSPSYFIDSDAPKIIEFSRSIVLNEVDPVRQAVALYYAVRDGFRYDPYDISLDAEAFKASNILSSGKGWCVTKAILLAACCRSLGIPARLGFADVSNHLSTERMRQTMQTNIFYWHGYTSLYLQGKWVKATPAFNIELCRKFHLKPLEFNGQEDSIYHEFDEKGNKHMEYLNDRGEYLDLPLKEITDTFKQFYPNLITLNPDADFDKDVANETS